jgi:hypothetical protein
MPTITQSITMKKRSRASLTATLFAIAAIAPAFGSGSYSNNAPKPRADSGGMKLDRDKYDLGQKIYDGQMALPARSEAQAGAQMERLKMLQAKLPAETGMKKDLVALAGKLTAQQIEALEYFVEHRFGMMKK